MSWTRDNALGEFAHREIIGVKHKLLGSHISSRRWILSSQQSRFLDPDQTVRFDPNNRDALTNTVFLSTRTVLCTKSMKLFEPQLNRPIWEPWTVLTVQVNAFKKKKKKNLEAHSTLSPWLKLQPLLDVVKHWKYWDPIIPLSLALSLVCSLSRTFFFLIFFSFSSCLVFLPLLHLGVA